MSQQATAIAGAEYELTVIPEINSGHAQLANLAKARLLPNHKLATNTISEVRPVSLLSNNEIFSKGTKNALLNLMNDQRLKNSAESEFNPKNSKIVMCGLPAGFIDEIRFPKVYVTDANAGYFVTQNYDENQSIVNVRYEKNDILIQDVVFESIKLSFDTRLIIAPNGFDNCDFNEGSPSLLNEIINDRIRFQMLGIVPSSESSYQDVDGDGFNEHGKVYSDLVSDPKYAELTEEKIQSILLNCATSELLKKYLQIIVGVKLGEENFPMSNTFKSQLVDNSIGIDGGTPTIEVLESMFNISGLNLSLDPLIIENLLTADSKVAKETEFSESTASSPVLVDLDKFSLPSSPIVEAVGANVSQVQQVSQLLSSAFFKPYALMGECIVPKMFESILFTIIDPDEFVIDENATSADIIYDLENIGVAIRSSTDGKLRILRTDDNNASSSNLNEYFITCNVADISDIKTLEEVSTESGRPTEATRR